MAEFFDKDNNDNSNRKNPSPHRSPVKMKSKRNRLRPIDLKAGIEFMEKGQKLEAHDSSRRNIMNNSPNIRLINQNYEKKSGDGD